MNNKTFQLLFFIALGMLVYLPVVVICQTSGMKKQVNYNYLQLAFERFGNDTVFNFSPKKTYVLCSKKIDSLNMNPNVPTEFFVVKTKNGKILYDDKISRSVVCWQSDYELLIVTQKGIITSTIDDGKYAYVYNIKTHMKTDKKHSLNFK